MATPAPRGSQRRQLASKVRAAWPGLAQGRMPGLAPIYVIDPGDYLVRDDFDWTCPDEVTVTATPTSTVHMSAGGDYVEDPDPAVQVTQYRASLAQAYGGFDTAPGDPTDPGVASSVSAAGTVPVHALVYYTDTAYHFDLPANTSPPLPPGAVDVVYRTPTGRWVGPPHYHARFQVNSEESSADAGGATLREMPLDDTSGWDPGGLAGMGVLGTISHPTSPLSTPATFDFDTANGDDFRYVIAADVIVTGTVVDFVDGPSVVTLAAPTMTRTCKPACYRYVFPVITGGGGGADLTPAFWYIAADATPDTWPARGGFGSDLAAVGTPAVVAGVAGEAAMNGRYQGAVSGHTFTDGLTVLAVISGTRTFAELDGATVAGFVLTDTDAGRLTSQFLDTTPTTHQDKYDAPSGDTIIEWSALGDTSSMSYGGSPQTPISGESFGSPTTGTEEITFLALAAGGSSLLSEWIAYDSSDTAGLADARTYLAAKYGLSD